MKEQMWDNFLQCYNENKLEIEIKLKGFKDLWNNGTDTDIFSELSYCLLTPAAKAQNALNAITKLKKTNTIIDGSREDIKEILKRNKLGLYNIKSDRIIHNRKIYFPDTKEKLLKKYMTMDIFVVREMIRTDIKGFGLKEASHFLRNIGFTEKIIILDRHIINFLIEMGIIEKKYRLNSKKTSLYDSEYHKIEEKVIALSNGINIPTEAFDFIVMKLKNINIIK